MSVFISHSFENRPEFENVVDALVSASVPYWDPASVKSGASLRDQLRSAVEQCSVCIFVATNKALETSWCGAELGAFWGAGKPVIVYLADSSVTDKQLPPIVQGDVWERRISRVAARAKELVARHGTAGVSGYGTGPRVGHLTVEQLEKLIIGAVSLAAAQGKTEGREVSAQTIGRVAKGAAGSVLEGIKSTVRTGTASADRWRRTILWVDDHPDNNTYERTALESVGLTVEIALSTAQAAKALSQERFAVIISDLARKEGPKEGYVLLDAVRSVDAETPFLIYTGSASPTLKREAIKRGAQGSTDRPQELFDLVMQVLPR